MTSSLALSHVARLPRLLRRSSRGAFLCLLVALATGVGTAQAQSAQTAAGVASPEGISDTATGTEAAGAETLSKIPSGPPHELQPTYLAEVWEQRRQALAGGDAEAAAKHLAELLRAKARAGWPNSFVHGEALARESRALMGTDAARATALAQAAIELAPHLPKTHAALAEAQWAQGQWFAALRTSLRAALLTWSEPLLWRTWVGDVLLGLGLAALVAGAAFVAAALYLHVGVLAHDARHFLPRGVGQAQVILLLGVVLLLPVLLRVGVGWSVLLGAALGSLQYSSSERGTAGLILVTLAAGAVGFPWYTSHFALAGSRAERIYLAARDAMATDAEQGILAETWPDGEELFVVGMRAYWAGRIDDARALFERAAKSGYAAAELHTMLGNTYYLAADLPAATAAYEAALAHEPDHVVAYFNLSRAYYGLAEQQRAGEAYRKATSIDYERVERFNAEAKRHGQGYVVRDDVPRHVLAAGRFGGAEHEHAADQLWAWVAGHMPRKIFGWMAISLALWVMAAGLLLPVLRPSRACSRCGRPACARCSPTLHDQGQCSQCFHAFVVRESVEPSARIRKEIEVHRYQARQERVRRVMSLLTTGGAQLLRRASLRGYILLGTFLAAVFVMLAYLDILPRGVRSPVEPHWMPVVVGACVAAAAHALSVWDALRAED